jgi:hypothetical protein
VGYFLPSFQNTRVEFLKAILKGEKKALKAKDVSHIAVPHFKELSVKRLLLESMSFPEIRSYLPEGKMLGSKKSPE